MSSDLSKDVIDQLTPLLGSLAQLLASGSQLTEDDLPILLMGTDLEPDPIALEELRHWGTLLRTVQEEPSEERRRSTAETLMSLGLPEDTVLLAESTVAESDAQPPTMMATSSGQRLKVSVSSLEFGALLPQQTGTAEIEVQGGPGLVMVKSAHVQVTPLQFGTGTAQLRVEVREPDDHLLWASIKLVVLEETIEVPVLASWGEPELLSELPQLPPEVARLLCEGSPFMPSLNQHVLTRIMRDLDSGECRHEGEAIARQLLSLPTLRGIRMFMKATEGDEHFSLEDVEQYRRGFDQYANGFMNPIELLYFAYGALPEKLGGAGIPAARQYLAELDVDPAGRERRSRDYIDVNLEYAVEQLRFNLSGRRLLRELLEKERARNTDVFYTVGMAAAYRVFAAYWEEVDKRTT